MTTEKPKDSVSLLDEEGDLTDQCEKCLKQIFAKYCTPQPKDLPTGSITEPPVPPEDAYLTDEGLDKWASETNGAPFSEDQKEELQMLSVNDDGHLTQVCGVHTTLSVTDRKRWGGDLERFDRAWL
ncbi:hypothetical protein BDN71DRAFT_1439855 [Pleurotus eryngii]|uniref:Uncharacterized protein n=1 Tax=Pleurotus eryngii TaxID=5323 RepID=A0A9P6DJS8_PLEER|nr:hypothetical protein BDN71DRAFT_1439855 [Pleurotus eryngii]